MGQICIIFKFDSKRYLSIHKHSGGDGGGLNKPAHISSSGGDDGEWYYLQINQIYSGVMRLSNVVAPPIGSVVVIVMVVVIEVPISRANSILFRGRSAPERYRDDQLWLLGQTESFPPFSLSLYKLRVITCVCPLITINGFDWLNTRQKVQRLALCVVLLVVVSSLALTLNYISLVMMVNGGVGLMMACVLVPSD